MSMQQHSAHTPTYPCNNEEITMQSIIALKQPLKHFLRMLVVLSIFAIGFMFAVVETMNGRYGVEISEIQKPVTVSIVEIAAGSKAPGLKTTNISPLP